MSIKGFITNGVNAFVPEAIIAKEWEFFLSFFLPNSENIYS